MTYEEFALYIKTLSAFYPEKTPTIKVYIDYHSFIEFEITDKGVESNKFWEKKHDR